MWRKIFGSGLKFRIDSGDVGLESTNLEEKITPQSVDEPDLDEREAPGMLRKVIAFPWVIVKIFLAVMIAPVRTSGRRIAWYVLGIASIAVAYAVIDEARTSNLQARYFSQIANQVFYWVEPGESGRISFPGEGPYDRRLGYSHLPEALSRLEAQGFEVTSQAWHSPRMAQLVRHGAFPIYPEKKQAGLTILDRDAKKIFERRYPEQVFEDYGAIPELLVQTLLYIENRELLDLDYPHRNPAVEWKRLILAVGMLAARTIDGDRGRNVPGGSTLATQVEKFRHSPEGRTEDTLEKMRQMVTASIRAYTDGEETLGAQERIIMAYLNGVPLAAVDGVGEIHGMADALRAWYGADVEQTMAALERARSGDLTGAALDEAARAYRQVLSLMLSQRRPSYYLVQDPAALAELTDRYLRILARDHVIDEALRDAALKVSLTLARTSPEPETVSFVERKAIDGIRMRLLSDLGIRGFYDLDRFDMVAHTTLDHAAQEGVTSILQQLDDPEFTRELGLQGYRMLGGKDAHESPVYSFTLYEQTERGNLLRVQADNHAQPLNINEQVKLDLGSTAKLRTLITYLEVIAEQHEELGGLASEELRARAAQARDPLRSWSATYLSRASDRSLKVMLDAAMERSYSGSPTESFFTGGGMHRFSNFDNKRNGVMSLLVAFRHSVNLPFIRLMRDLVRYHMFEDAERIDRLLTERADPERRDYLERFAETEGRTFQGRFITRYRGKDADAILEELVRGRTLTPMRMAVAYRSVAPEKSFEDFAAFMQRHRPGLPRSEELGEQLLADLYAKHAPGEFDLNDRGYLSRVHPLELWTAAYLRVHPEAGFSQVMSASHDERQEVYRWLFRTSRKPAQDQRIRILLEEDAFVQIHQRWKRLGYPFDSLVPSYATSIGSSADRPAALAELIGILLHDGIRLPLVRVEELEFAVDTPFETVLRRKPPIGERVMMPEVAQAARKALLDVTQSGTARRVQGGFIAQSGAEFEVGGKTGTGDHRFKRFVGGHMIESRVVNRTATFVFFLGKRFFGTMTVFVPGDEAKNFNFTSALPVQLLRAMAPALMPMLDPPPAPEPIEKVMIPGFDLVAQLNEPPAVSPTSDEHAVLASGLNLLPNGETVAQVLASPPSAEVDADEHEMLALCLEEPETGRAFDTTVWELSRSLGLAKRALVDRHKVASVSLPSVASARQTHDLALLKNRELAAPAYVIGAGVVGAGDERTIKVAANEVTIEKSASPATNARADLANDLWPGVRLDPLIERALQDNQYALPAVMPQVPPDSSSRTEAAAW